jgi:two-component sensor histidine kinase
VESLQLLYQEMSDGGGVGAKTEQISLGAYLSRVVAAIAAIGSGGGVRTNTDIDFMESSPERAAQLGLVLSEILTNAYQHAFEGRPHGLVEVRLKRFEQGARLQVIDDGWGIPNDKSWPESGSLGGRIVRSLVAGLGARLAVDRKTTGTEITVDIPDQRWD